MPAQNTVSLRIDQQNIATENGAVTLDIPKVYDYASFYVTIMATINVTAALTAKSIFGWIQLLRRIELISNGSFVLFNVSGIAAMVQAVIDRQILSLTNPSIIRISGTGTGTQTIAIRVPVDCALIDMVRPKDTNLRSANLSTLQMRVTLGAIADCLTAGTATLTSCSVRLDADAVQEFPDAGGKLTTPGFLKRVTQIDVGITSANSNNQVKIPVGNLLKRVMVIGLGNAQQDFVGTAVNNLRLQRGTDVRYDRGVFQSVFDQFSIRANFSPLEGIYIADFTRFGDPQGRIADAWNLSGNADAYAVLDNTAVTNGVASIITTELIPRKVS